MKKNILMILFVTFSVTFLLNGCSSVKIKTKSDTVTNDFLEKTYGKSANIMADFYTEAQFNYGIQTQKKAIFEDKNLTDLQKDDALTKLNSTKYVEDQYLYYLLNTVEPQLEKNLKLNISLVNSKNESIMESLTFGKFTVNYYNQYGGGTYFMYVWKVKSKKPVTVENYKDNLPVDMIVEYPGGQKTVFEVIK